MRKGAKRDVARIVLYCFSATFAMIALAAGIALFGPHQQGTQAQNAGSDAEQAAASSEPASAAGSAPKEALEADDVGAGKEHAHQWKESESIRHVAEKSHVETVTVPGDDITETHTVCDECGAYLDTEKALEQHYRNNPSHAAKGYTIGVPVVVGQAPGTTEKRTVVDVPAHDEVVVTKTCVVCGAVEQETRSE